VALYELQSAFPNLFGLSLGLVKMNQSQAPTTHPEHFPYAVEMSRMLGSGEKVVQMQRTQSNIALLLLENCGTADQPAQVYAFRVWVNWLLDSHSDVHPVTDAGPHHRDTESTERDAEDGSGGGDGVGRGGGGGGVGDRTTEHKARVVEDLGRDLASGSVLLRLAEITLQQQVSAEHKTYTRPTSRSRRTHNVQVVLDCMRDNGLPVFCTARQIVDAHLPSLLRLLWRLFYRFHAKRTPGSEEKSLCRFCFQCVAVSLSVVF
jgi:Calponin homology (CH) domain